MIDFYKVRQYTDDCNKKLTEIVEDHDIDMKYLKRVAQEMGFQTTYSYSEAINLVSNDLSNGLDINKIILKYGLDKELI